MVNTPIAMANNAALATALSALAQAVTNMTNLAQQAPPTLAPPATTASVLDPFVSAFPFNLLSCVGSVTFADSSVLLSKPWDSSIGSFPLFIIFLWIWAVRACWNAPSPLGILNFGGKNLLTNYHSLNKAVILAAHTACTDLCIVQNSKALYKCLKLSITGDLCATISEQSGNLPAIKDGPSLFKKLTNFTMLLFSFPCSTFARSLSSILLIMPFAFWWSIPSFYNFLSLLPPANAL